MSSPINPNNIWIFLRFRIWNQTTGRRSYKGKNLSRNNYIHLPIPIYFSLQPIPCPGVWRLRHYPVEINFTEISLLPDLTILPQTPVLFIIDLCTAHILMVITSLFSSTHMVWTLLQEFTLQLRSPYSPATKMVYCHGRSLKRFIFQSAINLTPIISGLSLSHPPRRYPFVGLPENHVLP